MKIQLPVPRYPLYSKMVLGRELHHVQSAQGNCLFLEPEREMILMLSLPVDNVVVSPFSSETVLISAPCLRSVLYSASVPCLGVGAILSFSDIVGTLSVTGVVFGAVVDTEAYFGTRILTGARAADCIHSQRSGLCWHRSCDSGQF